MNEQDLSIRFNSGSLARANQNGLANKLSGSGRLLLGLSGAETGQETSMSSRDSAVRPNTAKPGVLVVTALPQFTGS